MSEQEGVHFEPVKNENLNNSAGYRCVPFWNGGFFLVGLGYAIGQQLAPECAQANSQQACSLNFVFVGGVIGLKNMVLFYVGKRCNGFRG